MALQLPNSKRALIQKAGSSIFIAVSIASVIIAFCIVAINFMWDQSKYNGRVHSEKEVSRDTLISNVENAFALQDDFKLLEAADNLIPGQEQKKNSAVILDALPRRYDFPALRTSVDKITALSSVDLTGFNGNDEESDAIVSMVEPTPQSIGFSLSVEGDYKKINEFLEDLENTIRPMQITAFRLSGSDKSMTASLEVITYYQPSVDIEIITRNIE